MKRLLSDAAPILLAVLLAGCGASDDGPRKDIRSGTPVPTMSTPSGAGGTIEVHPDGGPPSLECGETVVGSPLLRRLTRTELTNSLRDIFPQMQGKWSLVIPAGIVANNGFANHSGLKFSEQALGRDSKNGGTARNRAHSGYGVGTATRMRDDQSRPRVRGTDYRELRSSPISSPAHARRGDNAPRRLSRHCERS